MEHGFGRSADDHQNLANMIERRDAALTRSRGRLRYGRPCSNAQGSLGGLESIDGAL
jgi:hypothetical protein